MGSYQSQQKQRGQTSQQSALQYVLFAMISLSVVVMTILVFIIAQGNLGQAPNGRHPTPTPIVAVSPTSTSSPVPTPTEKPAPTPTQEPTPPETPTPMPTPPPGVLGYPLYSGNPSLPEIALTFDDGPNPPYTGQILALLQQYHVKATFFVIGSQAAAYPSLVELEYQQGNVVGNHTWTHPNLTVLSPAAIRNELQSTSSEIEAITGKLPVVFRPPGGNFNNTVQSIAASLGLSTILWNVDPRDWSRPGTGVIIQRVLSAVHNGSIILMHDGGGDRSQTVAAFSTILPTLEQRGFQFVTVPRMIQDLASQGTAPTRQAPEQLSPEGAFIPVSMVICVTSEYWYRCPYTLGVMKGKEKNVCSTIKEKMLCQPKTTRRWEE